MFGKKEILKKLTEMNNHLISLSLSVSKEPITKKSDPFITLVRENIRVEKLLKEALEENKQLKKDNSVLFEHNKQLIGSSEDQCKKIKALEDIMDKFKQCESATGQVTIIEDNKVKVVEINDINELKQIIEKAKKGKLRIL